MFWIISIETNDKVDEIKFTKNTSLLNSSDKFIVVRDNQNITIVSVRDLKFYCNTSKIDAQRGSFFVSFANDSKIFLGIFDKISYTIQFYKNSAENPLKLNLFHNKFNLRKNVETKFFEVTDMSNYLAVIDKSNLCYYDLTNNSHSPILETEIEVNKYKTIRKTDNIIAWHANALIYIYIYEKKTIRKIIQNFEDSVNEVKVFGNYLCADLKTTIYIYELSKLTKNGKFEVKYEISSFLIWGTNSHTLTEIVITPDLNYLIISNNSLKRLKVFRLNNCLSILSEHIIYLNIAKGALFANDRYVLVKFINGQLVSYLFLDRLRDTDNYEERKKQLQISDLETNNLK